jgi:outer membrane protein
MKGLSRLLAFAALAPGPTAHAERITLEDALTMASQANPDVRGARLLQQEAAVDVQTSYSNVLPQLNLGAQFTDYLVGPRTTVQTLPTSLSIDLECGNPPVMCPAGTLPTGQQLTLGIQGETYALTPIATPSFNYPDYLLGLTLTETLFDGFKSWNTISKAKSLETVARRSTDETWLTVAFETVRRYYEVVRAQRTLAELEETVTRSADVVKRAQALFLAGRGPKSDVVAAEVNLGSDRINVEQQKGRVDQSRADLAFEIGRKPEDPIEVVPPPDVDAPIGGHMDEVPALGDLVDEARRIHPTLARFRAQIESADLDARIADSTWYPQVGIQGSYSREGPDLVGGEAVYGNPTRQYIASGQIFINWNLFQGFSTRTGQIHAGLAAEKVRVDAEQAQRQVADAINRARTQALAVSRTIPIAEQNLASADEGIRLAKERFDAGVGTQLEIRDADLKLTQAKLTVLNSRVDYAIARADLKRATGSL